MKQKIPGLAFIVLGLLLAALPFWVLPVCDQSVATAAGGQMPMRCHWTARAELGLGLLVAFGGLLYCVAPEKGLRPGLAIMQAGAACLAFLMPELFIPVCDGARMPCHIGTQHGLRIVSLLTLFLALGCTFSDIPLRHPLSWTRQRKP